jgi:molybdenum cofactor biosynthesis enzyme MoaA
MTRSWIHKDELSRQGDFYRKQLDDLRAVIVELAAALVRLDTNGYQARLLEKTLKQAGVKREAVDAFNEQRAEALARKTARP